MSSPIGDYLFWKLATIGARQVLGHGQRDETPGKLVVSSSDFDPGTVFIGSIQRNRLAHVDITRSRPILSSTEVGAFVVSSDPTDLAACFEMGRQYFPSRPVILIQELSNAEFRSAPDLTVGFSFAAAIVLHASSMAATQIDQALNMMLYYNQPVYIGISTATAGTIIALPAGVSPGSGSSGSSGSTVSAGQLNAASAAVAMSFIR